MNLCCDLNEPGAIQRSPLLSNFEWSDVEAVRLAVKIRHNNFINILSPDIDIQYSDVNFQYFDVKIHCQDVNNQYFDVKIQHLSRS